MPRVWGSNHTGAGGLSELPGLSVGGRRKKIVCPHCGNVADYRNVDKEDSGGGYWYEPLESLGYYTPHSDDDWYGKDMVLTDEQAKEMYQFVMKNSPYNYGNISALISRAIMEGDDVVINADW